MTHANPETPTTLTPETLSQSGLMRVGNRPDALMVRGEGSFLFDSTGKRYLDFVQGWAVNSFGHCPMVVRDALLEQAAQLVNAGPGFHTQPAHLLASALGRAAQLDHAFFTSSGAEANEGAIKLARKWGKLKRSGAFEIITTQGSFHGRTLATMSASGKPGFDALFPPCVPGFVKVTYGDAQAVANAIGERTVAVLVEPIQGEAGVVMPPDGYLQELREITEARGVLLMLDEVQTGMGRTGKLFACEHAGVRPDVMTLGKGLGAGVPIGALLARAEVSCFAPGDQGGTFTGHPLMAAVGLRVLQALQTKGFLDAVARVAEHLRAGLWRVATEHGAIEVRGRGMLLGLQLAEPIAAKVASIALARGLLVNAAQPAILRFMPQLNTTPAEIDQMLSVLHDALSEARGL